MTRDKDEFWAITDPDGRVLSGTCLTRAEAIGGLFGGPVFSKGRATLTAKAQRKWQSFYRQGYRAVRVRVEVIR